VVLFPEGLKKVSSSLAELTTGDILYINAELLPVVTRAQVVPLDFSKLRRKVHWSMVAMAEVLHNSGIYPLEALREAIMLDSRYAEENLKAIESGLEKGIVERD
jgi:hypothetical protein